MTHSYPKGIIDVLRASMGDSCDYSAEIALPREQALDSIQEYGSEDNQFIITRKANLYVSKHSNCSLIRALLFGIPPRIYWKTEDTAKDKIILRMKYSFSMWIRMQLYFMLALLWLLLNYICSLPSESIITEFIIRVVAITILGLLLTLSSRYRRFGENFLKNVFLNHIPKVHIRSLPQEEAPRKILIEPFLVILFILLQFSSSDSIYSGSLIQNIYLITLLFFAGLFFYFALNSLSGQLPASRILPIGIQMMLLAGFIMAIFLLPNGIHSIMRHCARSNLSFQQNCRVSFDFAF